MAKQHRLTIQIPATMHRQLDKACRSYDVAPDAMIRSLLEYYFKLEDLIRPNGLKFIRIVPRKGTRAA